MPYAKKEKNVNNKVSKDSPINCVSFLGTRAFKVAWELNHQESFVYINNGLHLARKYARIFVRGHYLLFS